MDGSARHLDSLFELEARHDDLLRRLEELDKRVEKVLSECLGPAKQEAAGRSPAMGSG
ncbi:MAG: hypothetical protein ACYTG0_11180 [Planctomycetota bacterium]|jgi:tetrahydromethanopterin S-methyltransferase subunit G